MAVPHVIPAHVIAAGARRERIIKAFRRAGAMSEGRAAPLGQLELDRDDSFRTMEKGRIIRSVMEDRFYLDEEALRQENIRGVRIAMVVVAAIAVIILVVLAFR